MSPAIYERSADKEGGYALAERVEFAEKWYDEFVKGEIN